jgi:hypothetical protein
MSSDTETVARFGYRHEAELAQGYLNDAGIASLLVTDDAGGAYAGMMFTRAARLVVRAGDLARARRVLEEAGVLGDAPDRTDADEAGDGLH